MQQATFKVKQPTSVEFTRWCGRRTMLTNTKRDPSVATSQVVSWLSCLERHGAGHFLLVRHAHWHWVQATPTWRTSTSLFLRISSSGRTPCSTLAIIWLQFQKLTTWMAFHCGWSLGDYNGSDNHQPKPHVFDLWCASAVSCPFMRNYNHCRDFRLINGSPTTDDSFTSTVEEELPQPETAILVADHDALNDLLIECQKMALDQINVVTYGLLTVDQGMRTTTAAAAVDALQAAITVLWADYFENGRIGHLHLIIPQELLVANTIQFLIEFESVHVPLPQWDVPVLVKTTTWRNGAVNAQVSYHTPGITGFEFLVQAQLRETYHPWTSTECNVHLEKRITHLPERLPLQKGSLLEIFVYNDDEPQDSSGLSQVECKPNPTIVAEHDDYLPYRHVTPQGQEIVGWRIAAPNWIDNPLVRTAAAAGATQRDDDGNLQTLFRTWLATGPVRLGPRDLIVNTQLLFELPRFLRRLWRDTFAAGDSLTYTVVRPQPAAGPDGLRPVHLLLEKNRPDGSPLVPVLFSIREIDRNGPSTLVRWYPLLLRSPLTTSQVLQNCPLPCQVHHLLVPQVGRTRRWLGPDHQRDLTPGLFLPIWWDLRLTPTPVAPYEQVEDTTSLVQIVMPSDNDNEATSLMQRPLQTDSETPEPSAITAHVWRMSSHHQVVQLQLQPSTTFSEQLQHMAVVPHGETITTIHEVMEPPRDLQETAEVTLLLELPRDELRRASPDDSLILVDLQIVDRGYLSPGTKIRKVLWSRSRMTRQAMLHLLSAADFCGDASSDCILWKNKQYWPADDGAVRQIAPGDYVRLLVRGHESLTIPDIQHCLQAQEQADASRYIFRSSPPDEEVIGEESEQDPSGSDDPPVSRRSRTRSPSLLQLSLSTTKTVTACSDEQSHDQMTHVSDRWCSDGLQSSSTEQASDNSSHISLDFHEVIVEFEWFDAHFCLPCFDVPESFPFLPSGHAWLQLPWWAPHHGAQCMYAYLDGSADRGPKGPAGSGVALFIFSDDQWYFAGAHSAELEAGVGSYNAEAYAAVIALKAVHDTCKLVATVQTTPPEVHLIYDSLTVGQQMLGHWASRSNTPICQLLRGIATLTTTRFGIELQGWHTRGHRGDVGNEIADVLAGQAAKGFALSDFTHFFQYTGTTSFLKATDWMWVLFRPDWTDRWKEHTVQLPAGPTTSPGLSVFPEALREGASCDERFALVEIRLATANVLTMRHGKDDENEGIAGPTRQEVILRQLYDAGVQLFALQETRLRSKLQPVDSRFHLYTSKATPQGHFGIMVGISKTWTLPCGDQESHRFDNNFVTVIDAEPRHLILRLKTPTLKFIIVAGHAPHTGATAGLMLR